MCLILFAHRTHPDYPLVLIANRDEYYARPTQHAHWWEDEAIFGGRDLEAGGGWLGVSPQGRIAAVTNVREGGTGGPGSKSRGALTRDYLSGNESPRSYLQRLRDGDQDFAGFNLLLGDHRELWFYSNRERRIRLVDAGVFGISNGGFDEAWPKLESGKAELRSALQDGVDESRLMAILTNGDTAARQDLPSTGVSEDIELLLSSRFIQSDGYGTRACSIVTIDRHRQIGFVEQNYDRHGKSGEAVRESFAIR